jgi:hypothetical protein
LITLALGFQNSQTHASSEEIGSIFRRRQTMAESRSLIPAKQIERSILLIRGQKVMLSLDLADLYGVEARVLIQAVKRNINRFPDDFMFQLNQEEFEILKSQNVISSL